MHTRLATLKLYEQVLLLASGAGGVGFGYAEFEVNRNICSLTSTREACLGQFTTARLVQMATLDAAIGVAIVATGLLILAWARRRQRA